MQEIIQYFQALEARLAAGDERVAALEQRLAEMEQRFVQKEQQFAEIKQQYAALEKQYADIQQHFTAVEQMLKEKAAAQLVAAPEPVVEPVAAPEPVQEEPIVVPEPEPVVPEPAPEPEPVVEQPAPEPEPVIEQPKVEPVVEQPKPEAPRAPQQTSLFGAPVTDIRQAVSIGDRFLFQRELFAGNAEKLQQTLTELDKLNSLDEAIVFIDKFGWDKQSATYELFLNVLRRRFQ